MSGSIHQNYSFINIRNSTQKEMPHMGRFNYNNKNIKLNILPHSYSQNKIIQYQQQSNSIPKIIYQEKIKNFYNFYEKENSKKSENSHNTTFNNNNIIEIKDLIGKNLNKPIELKMLNEPIAKFNQGKISSKSFGIITSYAANTNQGIARNYNEDRVSIIINMNKLNNYKSSLPWPKISYFAIFDGHAGNKCAEYLRENLLKLICSNHFFPENIPEAIRYGFEKADEQFLNNYAMVNGQLKDNSGTCGLILLIVNNEVYIGNVGDSRCIGSFNNGKIQRDITRDHKPNTPYEKERIIANGGVIYQTKTNIKVEENLILKNKILLGPYRVFPGRLSVSRTVGDAEGKIPILGGNPDVIICKPDIYKFNITENDIDYFILGCDGIYDQLSSKDVFKCVSLVLEKKKELLQKMDYNINLNEYKSLYGDNIDIHSTCGDIVDLILRASMIRQSYDNVTCLIICFKNLFNHNLQIVNDDIFENTRSKVEIYSSIKREPKILISSNSNNNYHKNNNNNSKKNINIHGISKIIQKLRSGNSDSSLFKKKEEIAIANEINEYSGKPMMNIYIKNNNKNNKENTLSNMNSFQSNSSINISLGNNHSHSINNKTYNYRDEKKNNIFNHKNNKNKEIQIIYKNINNNNLFYNPNNTFKSNVKNNSSINSDNEDFEDKTKKLFYNKKKLNYNIFKKKNELSDLKFEDKNETEVNKDIENKNNITNYNSRNIHNNNIKNTLILNDIYTNNDTSSKNIFKKDILNNEQNNDNVNDNLNISPSIKKKYNKNNEKEEENDKCDKKDIKKNIIDTNNNIINNNKNNNPITHNNFLTETKIQSNKVYQNLIKNKSNKINLLRNFDKINDNKNNNKNNNNNDIENDNYINLNEHKNSFHYTNKNLNTNSSFKNIKAFKSIGIKKIYPSPKLSFNSKDNKNNDKNNIVEYNNHKYYCSNNHSNEKINKNQKIKEKYDAFNISNKSNIKNNEYRNNNNIRNNNEIKIKYISQMRSNTEYNSNDKKY